MNSMINLSNYIAHTLGTAASRGRLVRDLELLMIHADEIVRTRVAENHTLSVEHLAELAGDSSSQVRIAIADNPSTPLAILELLALDDDPDVRFAIAENANLPIEVLRLLLQDENPYVGDRAARTIERIESSSKHNVVSLYRCA